nr:hypothetical protein [Tanacetum cinerariifolium]
VGAAIVASPVGVLELDTHSSSAADPSESSPPPIFVAPMVSPFLCLDDSEEDIPIGRLYHTHPGGPYRALTVKKSVRPLPSHHLALSIGMEVDVRIDVEDEVEDEVESNDGGTMEVRVDVVVGIGIHDAMLIPDAIERLEPV